MLTGGGGTDLFLFRPGEAAGDTIVDFDGVGDAVMFMGFGPGATFTQVDSTHWQANYLNDASPELIPFAIAAMVHASDVLFA